MTARRRTLAAGTWLAWEFGVTELVVEADGSSAAAAVERAIDGLVDDRVAADRATARAGVAPASSTPPSARVGPTLPELAQAVLAAAPLTDLPRFALVGEAPDAPGNVRAIVRGALAVRGDSAPDALAVRGDSAPDAPGRVDGAGAVVVAEGPVRGQLKLEISRPGGEPVAVPLREQGRGAETSTVGGGSTPTSAGGGQITQEYRELARGSSGDATRASARTAAAAPARGAAAASDDGESDSDFDGDTIVGGPVRRLRDEQAAPRRGSPGAGVADDGPVEQATERLAPPPAGSQVGASTRCGFVVDFGRSGRVDATGAVVIGRSPTASGGRTSDELPQLVTIEGVNDISRNHVRVELSGGVAIVTDLHSRNGTEVLMPGRARQRLRAGEPTAVVPGTVVDLGSGIEFTVRRPSRA